MTASLRYLFFPFLLTVLVGCQGASSPSAEPTNVEQGTDETSVESTDSSGTEDSNAESSKGEASEDKASQEVANGPGTTAVALSPGTYCYQLKTETEDIDTRITIAANDAVTGKSSGAVHNEAEGYYTSYSRKLNGIINGSNLDLDVATWIEYDKQNTQETWRVSPNELTLRNQSVLTKAPCSEVNKAFQDENGLEGEDLTSGAQNVKTQQVSFAPGESGTVVSDAVVRGDRNVYVLIAQGGQQMDLSMMSLEDNAVFDVVDPSGFILGTELTQEKIPLPYTGEYQVIVGGTRGNASYDLAIAIE
ncbi:MAG: hypothetical protein AAFQ95_08705 [Cyanobacteria bacterium J06621_3]